MARDFYIRQLRDWKFSIDIQAMKPAGMLLRRTVRLDPGPGARAVGGLDRDRELPRQRRRFRPGDRPFAAAYADQNERDHAALAKAAATGRVIAQRGL